MTHPFEILDPSKTYPKFAGRCALAVMAKAPRPGKVKTRLSPPLTPEQASTLNACFLRDTITSLHRATLAAHAEWLISYTPVGEEAAFRGILPDGALLLPQRGDGFGERLLFTAQDLFSCGFSAVCLIDSDSPTVPTMEFVAAAQALLQPGERAVLGPSDDGGYYLIGLQKPIAELFQKITWSTEHVTAETMQRAAHIGLSVDLLRRWYDVDDAKSLARLEAELFDSSSPLPRGYDASDTRRFLSSITAGRTDAVLAIGSAV